MTRVAESLLEQATERACDEIRGKQRVSVVNDAGDRSFFASFNAGEGLKEWIEGVSR
jgi:hypothetical protein